MEEAQWQGECARMGADLETCREIRKEMESQKAADSQEKQEDIGAVLEKYTKEYHRSTGF
ncbi:MAG: hypothetical protein ACLRMZ_18275 [Blautia marasmi]